MTPAWRVGHHEALNASDMRWMTNIKTTAAVRPFVAAPDFSHCTLGKANALKLFEHFVYTTE